ncbi:hypothetical protein Thermo_01722 [Thermoplasmatales archaeon]|nr:hypothetical protein Thermo_01722 [Thermoplasmatales archaeon]
MRTFAKLQFHGVSRSIIHCARVGAPGINYKLVLNNSVVYGFSVKTEKKREGEKDANERIGNENMAENPGIFKGISASDSKEGAGMIGILLLLIVAIVIRLLDPHIISALIKGTVVFP